MELAQSKKMTESRTGMSIVADSYLIHLEGKYCGKSGKGFNHKCCYIIFPRTNMWFEIVIHNDYKRQVVYKSKNEFLKDWTDFKPYNDCPNAIEFIKKIKSIKTNGGSNG